MLVGFTALVALLTVVVTGGRVAALAELQLRRTYLVAIALAAQVVVISIVPGSFDAMHKPVHIGTYVLLAAFLWSNRRVVGMPLIAAGAAANAAAIFANHGVMPASASALAQAGMPADKASEFANSAVVHQPHLTWLGDVFAVPASWPLSNVFSIGDVLIAVGVAVALHGLTGSRLATAAGSFRRRLAPTR
jgi:Family of unknown function (DUF5317)